MVCSSGRSWDLNGEPRAVLQAVLRVHVQHLVIDPPLSPASCFHKPGTYFSPPHGPSIGQYPLCRSPPTARSSLVGRTHQACYKHSRQCQDDPDGCLLSSIVSIFTPHASKQSVSLNAFNEHVGFNSYQSFSLFSYCSCCSYDFKTHTHTQAGQIAWQTYLQSPSSFFLSKSRKNKMHCYWQIGMKGLTREYVMVYYVNECNIKKNAWLTCIWDCTSRLKHPTTEPECYA